MQSIELSTQTGTYKSVSNDDSSFNKTGKFSSLTKGYRVEDGTPVVIKQIKKNDSVGDEGSLKLIREILINLHTLHPAISETYDMVRTDEGIFIIREFIEGIDLKAIIHNKKLEYFRTPDFTAKIGVQTCEILKTIHNQAIIHRDIKPANILIQNKPGNNLPDYYNPNVRLIDFELAQLRGMNIFTMNKVPVAMGYSAPEQLLRFQSLICPSSDLFALAITLYEFLSGKTAFHHSNPELLMTLQLNHPIIKHVRIPHELFAIMHKATSKQLFQLPPNRYSTEEKEYILSKGIENRFQKADELKAALEGFLMHYDAIPPAKNIFGKVRAFFR
jgi:eukaryotic-like serine/threonine-protein kinase